MKRILVDDGAAVEILLWESFKAMHFDEGYLRPKKPVFGFANQSVAVKGQVTLPVKLGQGENQVTVFVDFIVIDQPLGYKAIIGHPRMKKTNMVIAVFCLMIKFSTLARIGYVRANQSMAQSCYLRYLDLVHNNIATDIMEIDTFKPQPVEETVQIQLGLEETQTRSIGSLINKEEHALLTNLLQSNKDIFTWSAADIPRIPTSVILHTLNVD